jgi:hypothetical protein
VSGRTGLAPVQYDDGRKVGHSNKQWVHEHTETMDENSPDTTIKISDRQCECLHTSSGDFPLPETARSTGGVYLHS